ncbi:peptidylprolyl isomerase [Comamonas testosteroni]|uniref:Chaperone SurA n=1 Tax=Comamonas testosteroni TaxID=285 RepID=A0A8B4RZM8_COMTE|nr:peptidylprolyl isomerase [Comamonas testosteroni]EHN67735.1 PpiC-type peptidyl-prolyl cis-trans isomerase [Comamonas testosteroni ATCC 11996]QQN71148.1 peptidylprolyl isomerase [Comamonas testosteroni]SUY74430.1 Peptidyl-prolyl cis-trans isomerase surA [Comamonas testosteroni]
MRFFSKTSNACAVAVALAVMAAGVQAQGLKSPGSKAKAVNDPSISRALEATAQPSGRQAPAAAQGVRSADYIVAVVNSEPITNNEVRARMERVAQNVTEQGGQLPSQSELARQVLERLIVERVQLQEAKDTGINIDNMTVDQAVTNVARQNNTDKAGLVSRLKAEGISEAQFRSEIRNQMLMQRVRERDVDGRVKVTEADIDRYLKEQKRPGDAAAGAAANLGHILITVPENASPAVVAEREAKARQAAEAARKNPDFIAAVREFSDVPNGQGGGAMGMRPMSDYPELFSQQVGNAAVGAIVGPFRSGAGFHVLKVLEKSQAGAPVYITQNHARHILLTVGNGMTEAQAAKRLEDYKRRVESGQATFQQLAQEFSKDGSARNGGDLGWSSPGQFVPEFERVLDNLQPGQISNPVVSRFGVHLIQLIERRQEKLTEREQREMVRNVVRERKAEQDYETWLKELRGKAFVEYREPPQ